MAQWRQSNIAFPDWSQAERTAVKHVAPLLTAAESARRISAWFFIRKYPAWRVRYAIAAGAGKVESSIGQHLDQLVLSGHATSWASGIYEPEVHAFGGDEAMCSAHRLFHADSRLLLSHAGSSDQRFDGHRRELALLVSVSLLRGAGLDWYEQGDVWARVAAHREDHDSQKLLTSISNYLTTDSEAVLGDGSPLGVSAAWGKAFRTAGSDLAQFAADGHLRRGLRDVLAHHVIFTWNRHGLSHATQALLAASAKNAVFHSPVQFGSASAQASS